MRILLADSRAEVRSALRLLLEQMSDMVVVGETAAADALLAQTLAAQPDLVLLDWELPGWPMADLLALIRAQCVRVKVIALSVRPESRLAALDARIDAFVSKGEPPERLITVLLSFGR